MMMTIADLVNKGSWIVVVHVVNKLPKSGSYVVNFKICILNIHILPIHVKTHKIVYDFHQLFLKIIKGNLDCFLPGLAGYLYILRFVFYC
jgi:membrane protein YdbS with pleckstrin-like domain